MLYILTLPLVVGTQNIPSGDKWMVQWPFISIKLSQTFPHRKMGQWRGGGRGWIIASNEPPKSRSPATLWVPKTTSLSVALNPKHLEACNIHSSFKLELSNSRHIWRTAVSTCGQSSLPNPAWWNVIQSISSTPKSLTLEVSSQKTSLMQFVGFLGGANTCLLLVTSTDFFLSDKVLSSNLGEF